MGGEHRAVVMVNKMESALRRGALVSCLPSAAFGARLALCLQPSHWTAVQKSQARFDHYSFYCV